jgi:O-antigen ligase
MLVGAAALLVELTYSYRRRRVLLAGIPLMLAWVGGFQRASMVHFVVVVVAVCVVATGATWSRRIRATPTELGLFLAAAVAVGTLLSLGGASTTGELVPIGLDERFENAFTGVGNVQSADARLNKYAQGNDLIGERPLMGWGLAKEFTSFFPGINGIGVYSTTAVFDSVPYDLLVRTGAIGLVLFLLAVALSLRDGWRAWTRHHDDAVAALALAATAGLLGLLGKGIVESVLDKVVLSCALGVLVGVLAAAASDRTAGPRRMDDDRADAFAPVGAAPRAG